MRSRREIETRVRYVLAEELAHRLEEAERRLPHKCRYNHRQPLDVRKHIEGEPNPEYNRITQSEKRQLPVTQTLGLCMYGSQNPQEWPGTICEDEIDAKRCPVFEAHQTKEEIRAQFEEEVRNPEWLKEYLPEVHTLMWVLGVLFVPSLPWWLWLWYRLRRIEIEEHVVMVDAVVHLLPQPKDGNQESS